MELHFIDLVPLAPNTASADAPAEAEVFIPKGVCSKMIRFAVEDGKLVHVDFTGGCDGNLKGIAQLVQGMGVDEIIGKLDGITCGRKSTSCPDQLSRALREYMARRT